MWYIIWISVSAAIFSKTVESNGYEWLALPAIFSCVLGILYGFFALVGII